MINNSRIFYSILAGFLFIFFIISNIEFFKRKISTRSSFILFIIIVAVIIGLRGEDIGADTKGYSHNSKILEELTKKKSLSFYYFEIFVKQFFSNVLIIYSFISDLFIYLIINSGRFKNYLVALFFFMVCVAYNGYLINVVRQGIGILGCLYFLESNHNKYLKLIAYLFFVLFHQTVILLLLSNYISKFVFERNLFFLFY